MFVCQCASTIDKSSLIRGEYNIKYSFYLRASNNYNDDENDDDDENDEDDENGD